MRLKDVQMDVNKQKGKKLYLQEKKKMKAFVNLGMPIKCLPKKSHFEMKFYKVKRDQEGSELGYRQLDIRETPCVVFYILPIGKKGPGGKRLQRIMWCQELEEQRCRICVFALKGETIKEAVCKDGRFHSILGEKEWKIVENCETIHNSHYSVDDLDNRIFEVEVEIEHAGRAKNEQHDAATRAEQGEAFYQFKPAVLDQYPELKNQSELIKEFFKEEISRSRKGIKALLELHRKNFSKETKNSTAVWVHKLLAGLSNSVGYLEWDYNGNSGSATCFMLCDGYILTCRHVVSNATGAGVEEQHWAEISQSVKVTFSYEFKHPKEDDWFYLEPWLEISDQALDYVVLKLKGRSTKFPDGLAKHISSPPFSGLIYIIGHPDGKEKSTDGCSIVTRYECGWRCSERIQRGKVEDHSFTNCGTILENRTSGCIHMFTQRSFQEVNYNPHIVTYDTNFFGGSSGSPVFDASGHLIAMHTAGFLYKYRNQDHSIIEWGYSIEAILFDIKRKNPEWYESVLGELVKGTEDSFGHSEDTSKVPYNNCEGATRVETNDVTMESDHE
nr:protein FAM111A isoform X1 [Pelodiscus sinensis]XP_025039323.1 protein FAM111A isoform X1 [Pelodiscus sinensis]XP_025039324.1 protein FAM111A isoform X1 [Pelodiscus sinensis]|eukprot:XP_006120946.1 protein FAM111A isoform X1 [Pelodiscus sinensis]